MTPNIDDAQFRPVQVSAVPEDLAAYSAVGLQIDDHLAEPTKAFWRAMYRLRPVAATYDPRIPRILDFYKAPEENTVVAWLARARQVDAWVGKVASAFASAGSNPPLQGPKIKVSILSDKLDSAIAAGYSDAPTGLKLSGKMLRGPNGELFPVWAPPVTNASGPSSCSVSIHAPSFNAMSLITPDDPTSIPQTNAGSDPGWTVIDKVFGMTSINPPSPVEIAAGIVAPPLDGFGEPAGHDGYRPLLETLANAGAHSPEMSGSGGLPPDNPFLNDGKGPYGPPQPTQQKLGLGVDVLGMVNQSLGNVAHIRNGALAAYHTTYERNVDGRTRAVVRLYRIGIPPGEDKAITHAYYGSVDDDGRWDRPKPITVRPTSSTPEFRAP